MKDKRKIILGNQGVFPYKNKDNYINVEISKTSDEIIKEVVYNNFNLLEQFYNEREGSLKFCVYGVLNSLYTDTQNVDIQIKTNHDDIIYTPRAGENSNGSINHTVKSFTFSQNNTLTKNIFNKNKSIFYFLFELSPNYNNQGETKSLTLSINDPNRKFFLNQEIPFLFFNSEGEKVQFGTETVDVSSDGEQNIIENDFPFLYDTHWVKTYINVNRPRKVYFSRNLEEELDNDSVLENIGKYTFKIKLDEPSFYGTEEVEVFIVEDNTERGSGKDYKFKNQIIKWEKGEQYKDVEIEIIDDLFVEDNDVIVFGIRNLKFVDINNFNQTFKLKILNNDNPIPIGFLNIEETVKKENKQINIDLFLENAMPVPEQTVDVTIVKNNKITPGEPTQKTEREIELEELQKSPNYEVYLRAFESGVEIDDSAIEIRKKISKLSFYGNFISLGRVAKILLDTNIIVSKGIDWQEIFSEEVDESLIETTAILGEDIKPIESSSENESVDEFYRTINLKAGSQFASFQMELIDDFNYEIDKKVVFKLTNPSRNVILDKSRDTFILTIKDSLVPRYTRYRILGDKDGNKNGIFTSQRPIPNNKSQPIILSYLNDLSSNPNNTGTLTSLFPLNIYIKNKGVPIVYENKLIQKDETFILKQLSSGTDSLFFDLPTNDNLDTEKRQYKNSLYEFTISIDNERFDDYNVNELEKAVLKASYLEIKFDEVIVEANSLDSSENKGEKEYYLISELENLISKVRKNPKYTIFLRAAEAGVEKGESVIDIRNKIKILDFYKNLNFLIRNSKITSDAQDIFQENLDWQNIDLNDDKFKYTCDNFNQSNSLSEKLDVKFNGTIILPKIYQSGGLFSSDISKITPKLKRVSFEENKVNDFCEDNSINLTSALNYIDVYPLNN